MLQQVVNLNYLIQHNTLIEQSLFTLYILCILYIQVEPWSAYVRLYLHQTW